MASVQLAMFVGVLFGLLPAMGILYFMLDRYEGFFEDKRIFKFLMIGMVLGSVVTVFEMLLRFHEPAFIAQTELRVGLPLLAIGYPAIESAAKTAVLNWPSVVRRRDVPFYAVPLGLGFGAVYTFILMARGVIFTTAAPGFGDLSHLDLVLLYVPLIELFLAGILLHAFTATIIGQATVDGEPFRGLGLAVLFSVPYYLVYYWIYASSNPLLTILLPTAALVYGLVTVNHATKHILDKVVPPEMARKVRRDLRRRRMGLE